MAHLRIFPGGGRNQKNNKNIISENIIIISKKYYNNCKTYQLEEIFNYIIGYFGEVCSFSLLLSNPFLLQKMLNALLCVLHLLSY
jgi:hypothetical protein